MMDSDARQWQTALMNAISDSSAPPPPGIDAAGLAIYRNNYFATLYGCLRKVFAVCERIVGEECFAALCRDYVAIHRSTSGNLHDYGDDFAAFIADCPAQLPACLADMAELEWQRHRCYYAGDEAAIAPGELARHDPDEWPALRLTFLPECAVIISAWPIATLWHAHRDAPEDFSFTQEKQPEGVWIDRHSGTVDVTAVPLAEAVFLRALQDDETLETATDAALAVDPDYHPEPVLLRLFATGKVSMVHR